MRRSLRATGCARLRAALIPLARRRCARVERLEPRTLHAAAPIGPEFRVNTHLENNQLHPAVAAADDGHFVVAWASVGQDGFAGGIYAQRYNAEALPQGVEFRVAGHVEHAPSQPAVAMDADGDFVIAWESRGQVSGIDVVARRYDAAGVPLSDEFVVNPFTAGDQFAPSVAADADGNFVVAWHSNLQDGDGAGIFARRFGADGTPAGDEFRVNNTVADNQTVPAVAMDADGDFVVAWESYGQDGSDGGVYARRFGRAGAPEADEFRVNTVTAGAQTAPAVAIDSDGDFVVAWTSYGHLNSSEEVVAQRFDATGVRRGGEVVVNTVVAAPQVAPSVAIDADGDFVVSWVSYFQDGSGTGAFAQRFDAAGDRQGAEFRVNTVTAGRQEAPAVASDAEGNFTIAWHGNTPLPNSFDVFAQWYDGSVPTITVGDASVTEGGTGTVEARFTVSLSWPTDRIVRVGYAAADGTATAAGGDYQAASGVLEFLPGDTEKTVTVLVNGDTLPETNETFALNLSDAENAVAEDGAAVCTITNDDFPARVTAVFVDGSAWTSTFRNLLQAGGLGEAAFGYSMPPGAAQLAVLPWSGINRISLRFDRPPGDVGAAQQLRGVNTAGYGIAGFSYHEPTRTGTWSLSAPVAGDKLMIDLASAAGGLDGEWAHGADTFPSGDGTPGGDFRFRLNVLNGDVDRDGRVTALDWIDVRARLRRTIASPGTGATGYTLFQDVTGDGVIDSADQAEVRRNLSRQLPAGEPPAAAASVAAAAVRRTRAVPITRGMFGDERILG